MPCLLKKRRSDFFALSKIGIKETRKTDAKRLLAAPRVKGGTFDAESWAEKAKPHIIAATKRIAGDIIFLNFDILLKSTFYQ